MSDETRVSKVVHSVAPGTNHLLANRTPTLLSFTGDQGLVHVWSPDLGTERLVKVLIGAGIVAPISMIYHLVGKWGPIEPGALLSLALVYVPVPVMALWCASRHSGLKAVRSERLRLNAAGESERPKALVPAVRPTASLALAHDGRGDAHGRALTTRTGRLANFCLALAVGSVLVWPIAAILLVTWYWHGPMVDVLPLVRFYVVYLLLSLWLMSRIPSSYLASDSEGLSIGTGRKTRALRWTDIRALEIRYVRLGAFRRKCAHRSWPYKMFISAPDRIYVSLEHLDTADALIACVVENAALIEDQCHEGKFVRRDDLPTDAGRAIMSGPASVVETP